MAVSIPISMGYSQIAGLPAVYGLYGSVFPVSYTHLDVYKRQVLQQIQNVIKQKENNMLVATFNLRIADIKGINAAQKKKYCRENKLSLIHIFS